MLLFQNSMVVMVLSVSLILHAMEFQGGEIPDIKEYATHKNKELEAIERKRVALLEQKNAYETEDTGSVCGGPLSVLMTRYIDNELSALEMFKVVVTQDKHIAQTLVSMIVQKVHERTDIEAQVFKKNSELSLVLQQLAVQTTLAEKKRLEAVDFRKRLQEDEKKYAGEIDRVKKLLSEVEKKNKDLSKAHEALKEQKSETEKKYEEAVQKLSVIQSNQEEYFANYDACLEGIAYYVGKDGKEQSFSHAIPLFTRIIQAGYADLLLHVLSEQKIDLMVRNSFESTLLHEACSQGIEEVIHFLLDNGADLEARDNSDNTPMQEAVRRGKSLLIVQYLVNRGAKIDHKNKSNRTLLFHACSGGNVEIVTWLVKNYEAKKDVNTADVVGETPFFVACGSNGSKELLQYLLSIGAHKEIKSHIGKNPFHNLCFWHNVELVKYAIDELGFKASINVPDDEGKTPIHYACDRVSDQKKPVIKLLISHGADVHMKAKNGDSILHFAAYGGNPKLVKYLIEKQNLQGMVNHKNNLGETPLYRAIKIGCNADLLDYLLKMGANIDEQNNMGKTALFKACTYVNDGLPDMVKYLRSKGAKTGPSFIESVIKAKDGKVSPEILKLLV